MNDLLTAAGYKFDIATQIWTRAAYMSIDYNDGDAVEERLAEVIAQAQDIGVFSNELRLACTDWPSTYHLSVTRANLLRPFRSVLGRTVLEIGAGCGAITRYLGECGGHVVALEGSRRRAEIARLRTRDLPNVHVVGEAFDDFDCEFKFDVITLIGVLEYANLFTRGVHPALTMLERVRSLLAPEGLLIIAIENQLGLKYFAGEPEDHIGQPMYGIEGRYRKDQPQTFGRNALNALLKKAGYVTTRFLLPFPDYKFPVSVVTETGLAEPGFDASALAWQSVPKNSASSQCAVFAQERVWPTIFENRLATDFANSFLVTGSPAHVADCHSDILAYHYSNERRIAYAKETVFRRDDKGQLYVEYHPYVNAEEIEKVNSGTRYVRFERSPQAPYWHGTLLVNDFMELVSSDSWTFAQLGRYVQYYLAMLKSIDLPTGQSISWEGGDAQLPGEYLDLIPQNIIVRADGSGEVFDREWVAKDNVTVSYLIFRALTSSMNLVSRFAVCADQPQLDRQSLIVGAMTAAGFTVTPEDLIQFIRKEWEIQCEVVGRPVDWEAYRTANLHSRLPVENQASALRQGQQQLHALLQSIHQRDGEARKKELEQARIIARKTKRIQALMQEHEKALDELRTALDARNERIVTLEGSTFWRVTAPLRLLVHQAKRVRYAIALLRPAIQKGGGIAGAARIATRLLLREGFNGFRTGFRRVAGKKAVIALPVSEPLPKQGKNYQAWVSLYDNRNEDERQLLLQHVDALPVKPTISIIMPTFNSNVKWLTEAIESVRQQIYPHWELCVADDASSDQAVVDLIKHYVATDKRIRAVFRTSNGHIAEASNSALALVTSAWTGLLDHDDLLHEEALLWVVDAINRDAELKLVYTDEDKIDETGTRRFAPYFKCDWNVDLFYSHNMFAHFGVYSTALLRDIGGFRAGTEGSQDYDLVLRCLEQVSPQYIHHIPRVLYHWRSHEHSTASTIQAKFYATNAGVTALGEHLHRLGIAAEVTLAPYNLYRVRYALPEELPLVTLIVPTRNAYYLLRQCIDSVLSLTTYPRYEIYIVDNGSDDPATVVYLQELAKHFRISVQRDSSPFNYSALNNNAVRRARGDVIVLLNNDIEVITPDWLEELVSIAVQPGVGAVGAKLLYPNDTVQHAGVVLGFGGVAGHAHKNFARNDAGYCSRAMAIQSLSAVTGACLAIRKSIYMQVGGLNETDLTVAFNDVDFCLRVKEAGYRNVWTPYAELYHHESATRGSDLAPEKQERFAGEVRYMQETWGAALKRDPAYSPNLTLRSENFHFAWPPRIHRLPERMKGVEEK